MAYGLQIWAANGDIVLDTSDRFFFFMDVLTGSLASGADVDHTVTGANTTSTQWANGGEYYIDECPPVVTITTNNVNIENVSGALQPYTIIVYDDGTP